MPIAELNAENLCLGAILTDAAAWPIVNELLDPHDFEDEKHRYIARACQHLYASGKPIDLHSVALYLQQNGTLASAGGLSHLADLTADMPRISGLEQYCEVVKKAAIKREVLLHARSLIERCESGDEEAVDDLERIRGAFAKSTGKHRGSQTVEGLISNAGGWTGFLAADAHRGITLPWGGLQYCLDGLRPETMVVIGAMPGVGKSALAWEIAEAALEQGGTVLYVSLEMGAKRLIHRAITGRSSVSIYKLRRGELHETERDSLTQALWRLAAFGERFRLADSMSIAGLGAELRWMEQQGNPATLVVIDFLQLVNPGSMRNQNRTQEISSISRGIKCLTLTHHNCILALSNFSRQLGAINSQPQMNWLKESGQIESDADQICVLWPESEQMDVPVREINWKVPKNRDGNLSSGKLYFQTKYCRYQRDHESLKGAA
ncbi:MAG: replicative DNA helicase [Terriglobales bacterium]